MIEIYLTLVLLIVILLIANTIAFFAGGNTLRNQDTYKVEIADTQQFIRKRQILLKFFQIAGIICIPFAILIVIIAFTDSKFDRLDLSFLIPVAFATNFFAMINYVSAGRHR